jgi:hypothetical protein
MKFKFTILALVSGAICYSSLSARADTTRTNVVLSIGEQSNGGVDVAGNLATYLFGSTLTTLSSTSDAAGEVTTATAPSSNWLVTSGTAYILLKETDHNNAPTSDFLKITSSTATLYSDPQNWSSIIPQNIYDSLIRQVEATTDPTSFALACDDDCSFDLRDNIRATIKIYSDGSANEFDLSPVPLPAALPLFASGLGALGLLGWRRKRKAAALAA